MDPYFLDRFLERLDWLETQMNELSRRVERLEDRAAAPAAGEVAEPPRKVSPAMAVEAAAATEPPPTAVEIAIASPAPAPEPPPAVSPPPIPSPLPARPLDVAGVDRLLADHAQQAGVSPATAAAPPTPPAAPQGPGPWHDVLAQLNLLPPKAGEGGNLEIQVGTWWATRIGMLFLVIAMVFFGVYLAQFSRPWVRFIELTVTALGITGLGLWLGRRYPEYGEVVFGGGLAMIFFCAFAAYAVPAVKILDSALAGALLQYLATGAIVGCALWRESRVIATMAVLLGYVACFFSFSAGLSDYALLAGLALAASGAFFYQGRGWGLPFALAVPLTYVLYVTIYLFGWLDERNPPPFWICHAWLIAYLMLFAGTDVVGLLSGRLLEPVGRRALHLFSSSAAVFLGFLVTRALFRDMLSEYYFTYGAILTALAVGYYLFQHPDALMQGYFLKGSALITMGLINALGGRTRWIALGIESFIMLYSVRRTRLRLVEAVMAAAWFISLGFFISDALKAPVAARLAGETGAPLFSVGGAVALAYVVLSALLLGLQGRWLAPPRPARAAESAVDGVMEDVSARDAFNGFYALALAFLVIIFGEHYFPQDYEVTVFCLLLAALAGVGAIARHWIPLAALALPLLYTHVQFWQLPAGATPRLWINGEVVIAFTAAAAVLTGLRQRERTDVPENLTPWLAAQAVLHLLWMISLQVLYAKAFAPGVDLFLAVLSTAAIAAIAWRFPRALPFELAPVVVALALAHCFARTAPEGAFYHPAELGQEFFLWAAGLLAWGLACAFAAWAWLARAPLRFATHENWQWVGGVLALLAGFFVLGQSPALHADATVHWKLVLGWVAADRASLAAFGVAALAVALLAIWPGWKAAFYLGCVYLLIAHRVFYALAIPLGRVADPAFLTLAIALGALTLGTAPLAKRLPLNCSRARMRRIQGICGAMALLLWFWLFAFQGGGLAPYVTACWVVSAVAVFLAGLLDRAKPLRIIGLAGLALCIPRVFLMDLHSAFHRIVATGVLGGVVLGVAFLYNKYRGLIESRDETDSN